METSAAGMASPAGLVLAAIPVIAFAGFPGLFLQRFPGVGQKTAAILVVAASLVGLSGTLRLLTLPTTETYTLGWTLPFGPAELAIDSLSALFLLPVFLISACAAVYAIAYWPGRYNRSTEPALTFCTGLLCAAMAFLLVARNGVLFLIGWEVMAVAAYFALVTEHGRREVRRAGIIYLMATHVGTLALFVMFALLQKATGSFLLPASHSLAVSAAPAATIFLTALFGFGMKAGLMPLHLWLPSAHANAPSHVSALMSGVMLKMGIYGILRVISVFETSPVWWGIILILAGIFSAVAGVIFAIAEQDLKRLLAYSSIENIGIITIGIGMAVIGLATGNAALTLLGMGGALLHTLNHALFKPLLFLGSGAIIHASGTRDMDLMGGLGHRMPATALCFLVGAIAICGLPPLNGFVSEFFLYLGFFSEARTAAVPYLAVGAPLLALVGGLVCLCFIKLYGVVFLGAPRTAEAAKAHESSVPMLAPLATLAMLCIAGGLFPQALLMLVQPALSAWTAHSVAGSPLPPLQWLTVAGIVLLLGGALLAAILRYRLTSAPRGSGDTWGCGYLLTSPRVQYNACSFAESAVNLFRGLIRPRDRGATLSDYFPQRAAFSTSMPETILEQVVLPSFRVTGKGFSFLRIVQLGKIHIYMLYIAITLVLLLVWAYR